MRSRLLDQRSRYWLSTVLFLLATNVRLLAQSPDLDLDLPVESVSRRAAFNARIPANTRKTFAKLEGPGSIRHIWVARSNRKKPESRWHNYTRNVVIRIFFDGEEIPFVEAPLSDFFGVMHGQPWYPINTPYLSVQADSGYNSYFLMPFAKSARVEFEVGDQDEGVTFMVDWHQYPGAELKERRRFCSRWRRENPTQRAGEDFLMLDANGPGQLIGFVYGVRLIDNEDRWSYGGSDNIYIDGDGEHPSYLRGIGGEDTFGTSYGGSMHTPATRLYASMPYYQQFDDGQARPAKNLAGYRWFHDDSIKFQKSIHIRFGCMSNDICSVVYWYQQQPVRPFFRMPPFEKLAPGLRVAPSVPRGEFDLPLPDSGSWWISEVSENDSIELAARTPLQDVDEVDPENWKRQRAKHGFIDFLHSRRPHPRKAGIYIHEGTASARSTLEVSEGLTANLRLAWDDRLVLRVNDSPPIDLGHQDNFADRLIELPLRHGKNRIDITLSNSRNFNHGGWAFAFRAITPDGKVLIPLAE